MFGRRRNKSGPTDPIEAPEVEVDSPEESEESVKPAGPWDATEEPEDEITRVDLGALKVPTLDDVEVRVEADPSGSVAGVLLVHGRSGVQLGAFAAPRTDTIWDEVRAEIADGVIGAGGTTHETDGEFGVELSARVPGDDGLQPVRFVGVDGPRWFIRAVFTGAAALDRGADEVLTESLRQVVVVRGTDPMPVRDPLPLRLPKEVVEQHGDPQPEEEPAEVERPRINLPKRGPEITEVR